MWQLLNIPWTGRPGIPFSPVRTVWEKTISKFFTWFSILYQTYYTKYSKISEIPHILHLLGFRLYSVWFYFRVHFSYSLAQYRLPSSPNRSKMGTAECYNLWNHRIHDLYTCCYPQFCFSNSMDQAIFSLKFHIFSKLTIFGKIKFKTSPWKPDKFDSGSCFLRRM